MKIILAIFCGLVVLFAGGCALVLLADIQYGGAVFALIPGGIAVLNGLVLAGLWGKSEPQSWAFYLLAAVDVVAVLVIAIAWASMAGQMADIAVIALPLIIALAVKAWLTIRFARRPPAPGGGA